MCIPGEERKEHSLVLVRGCGGAHVSSEKSEKGAVDQQIEVVNPSGKALPLVHEQGGDKRMDQEVLLLVPHHEHQRVVVLQHCRVRAVGLRLIHQFVVLIKDAVCKK